MNKKYSILLTGSITSTIDKNLSKHNINVVTSKTVKVLVNTKQSNELKPEGGVYSIAINICHIKYIGANFVFPLYVEVFSFMELMTVNIVQECVSSEHFPLNF